MTARGEHGSITVMSIGFLLLLGALTVVVVNASAAFLQRQELNNLADGAALAAADGLDAAAFYERRQVVLSTSDVQSLVMQHIAGSEVRLTALEIEGDRVHVRLARPMDLPLVPPGWVDRAVVADASANLIDLAGADQLAARRAGFMLEAQAMMDSIRKKVD